MKAFLAAATMALAAAAPASARTVLDQWRAVQPPAQPQAQPVSVNPATTAYLVLDMQANICNAQSRPHCVDAVGPMADFLSRARAAGLPVVYSATPSAARGDILAPLAPKESEPIVRASVDKFHGTELDQILKQKGVDTVIVCGVTAYGAVLFTATEAAVRGYKVILPADCMPGSSFYEEQATVFTLTTGPGTARATTLTSLGEITIE